jgi:hypothetical protein
MRRFGRILRCRSSLLTRLVPRQVPGLACVYRKPNGNGRRVVPQKGPSSLTWRPESLDYVLDYVLGDIGQHQPKPELEQFTGNPAALLT